MRFTVDPWDPSYGASLDADGGSAGLAPSEAEVNLGLEVPPGRWAPVAPPPLGPGEPPAVLFVDGVRRVEARVWIEGEAGRADTGLCASYAAGVVCCDGMARVAAVEVGRGVFSASPFAEPIVTRHGTFGVVMAAASSPEALSLALQERMGLAEVQVAERALAAAGLASAVIVVDGPLRGRQHLPGAVGYIKSHHVAYLPDAEQAVVGQLAPGERTPLFTMRTAWSRHSWYVRLPGAVGSPWSGVVRCECPADLAPEQAVALADTVTALLPRFASVRHKDSRAPQNLFPISGLERDLRHRMGDPQVLYRALLSRAASVGVPNR